MPILLKELLRELEHEKKDGMIHVEEWRISEVEYLHNMEFDFIDDYKMSTSKPPIITIYKKEETDETTKKPTEYFYIDEVNKAIKRFKDFCDVINYFDTYIQPEFDKKR